MRRHMFKVKYKHAIPLLPMNKHSVLLVDDHPLLLEGTASLIEAQKHFTIKGRAQSAEDALVLLKKQDFDVLVTDYSLPGISGADLIEVARRVLPNIKTVVLSMHDDPSLVKEVIGLGVHAYVLKKDAPSQLVLALENAVKGKKYMSQEMGTVLANVLSMPDQPQVLTSREIEIVRLLAQELSNKQIAESLFISERTVETHRKNMLRKTGTNSIVGLLNYAYKHKLL